MTSRVSRLLKLGVTKAYQAAQELLLLRYDIFHASVILFTRHPELTVLICVAVFCISCTSRWQTDILQATHTRQVLDRHVWYKHLVDMPQALHMT